MSTEQMKQCQAPATHAPAGNKMTYTPPQMEVIKMDLEGVIAGSGNLSDFKAVPAEATTPHRAATWKT